MNMGFLLKGVCVVWYVVSMGCLLWSGVNASGATGSISSCRYVEGESFSDLLNKCKPSKVVDAENGLVLETGLKSKVNTWIRNISVFVGVGAVGVLVYAAFLLLFSKGEDEKITMAKKTITKTITGLIILIGSGAIVYIIIEVMFSLGGGTS